MSVEEIKRGISSLSSAELGEVTAFLFQVRHSVGSDYRERVDARLSERDCTRWVTPEEFERQLDQM